MEPIVLQRNGYGSAFNELIIEDTTISKRAKNDYGNNKIKKEIEFYKYIIAHKIHLPIPNIYEYYENGYKMEYIKNAIPLYRYFSSLSDTNKITLLETVHTYLSNMHNSTRRIVSKDIFMESIRKEFYEKIIERYAEIKNIVGQYSHITHVNGIKVDTFESILERTYNSIVRHFDQRGAYEFSLIHGDCQFNNILYDSVTKDIVFIDPRGYFGSSLLFGMSEYDYAKVRFALSGYDVFDNMTINRVNIEENNINIDYLFLMSDIMERHDAISIMVISIWLGNAHCFKHNHEKMLYSYFYALYLGTLYS